MKQLWAGEEDFAVGNLWEQTEQRTAIMAQGSLGAHSEGQKCSKYQVLSS